MQVYARPVPARRRRPASTTDPTGAAGRIARPISSSPISSSRRHGRLTVAAGRAIQPKIVRLEQIDDAAGVTEAGGDGQVPQIEGVFGVVRDRLGRLRWITLRGPAGSMVEPLSKRRLVAFGQGSRSTQGADGQCEAPQPFRVGGNSIQPRVRRRPRIDEPSPEDGRSAFGLPRSARARPRERQAVDVVEDLWRTGRIVVTVLQCLAVVLVPARTLEPFTSRRLKSALPVFAQQALIQAVDHRQDGGAPRMTARLHRLRRRVLLFGTPGGQACNPAGLGETTGIRGRIGLLQLQRIDRPEVPYARHAQPHQKLDLRPRPVAETFVEGLTGVGPEEHLRLMRGRERGVRLEKRGVVDDARHRHDEVGKVWLRQNIRPEPLPSGGGEEAVPVEGEHPTCQ